jgi:hypothetical protein
MVDFRKMTWDEENRLIVNDWRPLHYAALTPV